MDSDHSRTLGSVKSVSSVFILTHENERKRKRERHEKEIEGEKEEEREIEKEGEETSRIGR